jgi:4-amino-4-deoxy-L-arabinose transferase-like glycosyltransferase
MKNNLFFGKLVIVFVVTFFGFVLRYHNYDKVPFPGESMDEYSYSWMGMSLIKTGMPVGISGIDGYKNNISRYINVDRVFQNTASGNPMTINWPWFDHPPLLGLITGGYALSQGVENFEETNIFIIRRPMVILGSLTLFLVIILAWVCFGFNTAVISGLIYASSPVIVVGSRMVQGENGLIPWYLLTLISLVLYFKNKNKEWLIFGAVSAGLASLFKLSGVVAIMSGIFLLWSERNTLGIKWKEDVNKFSLISLAITSLFLLFGFIYGINQFVEIFNSNSERFYGIGSEAIYNLLIQVKITNRKFLTDPWILLGWVSMLVILMSNKLKLGEKVLVIGTFSYLGIYLMLGSHPYGWYVFPFFPTLIISLGLIFTKIFDSNRKMLSGVFLTLIPVGYFLTKFIDIVEFQKYASVWKFGLVGIILFFIAMRIDTKVILNKLGYRLLFGLIFLVSIYLNIRYVLMLTIDYWYKAI